MSILKSESYRKGVVFSSIFNVGGKSVAFIQQWLIGYYWGTQSDTDVFFFVYNIILFVSFFFLNLTTSVLIPEGMKIRNQEGEKRSQGFFNVFILIYMLFGGVLALAGGSMAKGLFLQISSFSTEVIEANIEMIRWCLPIAFLNIVVSIMTEILASYKYFTIPNLITCINYVVGVIFICVFHDILGMKSIAIGLIIGYLLNLIVVISLMKKAVKWDFRRYDKGACSKILKVGIFSQAGYVVYLVALYVPQYIFSQLPPGSLTAVNFADKMLSIPAIFLVTQITNVMAVKVNNLVSMGDRKELVRLTERLLITVTLLLVIASIFISLLSDWFVDLVFSWGKYTIESKVIMSRILSAMIFYLPFSFMFGIYMKFFNAFQRQDRFFWLQLFTQGITLIMYFVVIERYGLYSYPICRILPYMIVTLLALPVLKSLFKELPIQRIMLFHLIISVITLFFLFII